MEVEEGTEEEEVTEEAVAECRWWIQGVSGIIEQVHVWMLYIKMHNMMFVYLTVILEKCLRMFLF